MAEKRFIKGKNIKLTFQLAQPNAETKSFVCNCTSISVGPDVTKIADGIIGKPRDDLDSEINSYNVDLNMLVRDLKLLKGFLAHQREKDLNVSMAQSGVGLLVEPQDGTQVGFSLVDFVLDDWKLDISGRTDRVKLSVPGRCTDMVDLPSLSV